MSSNPNKKDLFQKKPAFLICLSLVEMGFVAFVPGFAARHPEKI
ncbi:MAG: hypothetical protein WBZ05_10745 [Desulfobacterales bacterium]